MRVLNAQMHKREIYIGNYIFFLRSFVIRDKLNNHFYRHEGKSLQKIRKIENYM